MLSWPSLGVWRMATRLTLLYKMANNLVIMLTMILIVPFPCSTTAMHPHAYMPMFHTPKRLYQYYSFLPRLVTDWNDLPKWIAAASSLEASKAPPMKHIASFSLSPRPIFLLLSYLTHIFSVLAPLPGRWISPSLFLLSFSLFFSFVFHNSLLIALIYSFTFSTIYRTPNIVNKLTCRHYHLKLHNMFINELAPGWCDCNFISKVLYKAQWMQQSVSVNFYLIYAKQCYAFDHVTWVWLGQSLAAAPH